METKVMEANGEAGIVADVKVSDLPGPDLWLTVVSEHAHPRVDETKIDVTRTDTDASTSTEDGYDPFFAPEIRDADDVEAELPWLLEYVADHAVSALFENGGEDVTDLKMSFAIKRHCDDLRDESTAGIDRHTFAFAAWTVSFAYEPGHDGDTGGPPGKARPPEPGIPPVVVNKPVWMSLGQAYEMVSKYIAFDRLASDLKLLETEFDLYDNVN